MTATAEKKVQQTEPEAIEIDINDISISAEQAPAIYGHNLLGRYVEAAKAAVLSEVPDLTTAKGRQRIASLSAMVSRSKTAVEVPGRNYLRALKDKIKPIEEELREFKTKMDSLRDQVRQPLTEWEAAEKEREERHRATLQRLQNLGSIAGLAADQYRALIDEVQVLEPTEEWGDFQMEAERLRELALKHLSAALDARIQYDADQIELARLREEAAERQRKEEAEAQRIAAEQAAAAAAAAAVERAERERLDAIQRAEQAERDAQAKAEQAAECERQRIAAEQAAEAEAKTRREANREHCAEINRTILAGFVAEAGITEAQARLLITAIAKGFINNVSIHY